MDDEKFNALYDVLENYKQAIDFLKGETEELREMYKTQGDRVAELENTLFEEIIKPTAAAENEKAFEAFHTKYGEKLDPYNDKLRALENDDSLDLSRQAFNGFKEYEAPEGMQPYSEEEYVDALIEQVEQQIADVKAKLGIPEDSKVELTEDENGNTSVKVDGEEVVSEETETVEATEEEAPAEEPSEDGNEEDDDQPSLFDETDLSAEGPVSEEELKEIKEEIGELKKEFKGAQF